VSDTLAITIPLPAEVVEAIAQRAAELVLERHGLASPASPYLTVAEAAEYLCCKRQRVDDLLSSGRLTRHKDGSRTLISRAELETHVAAKGSQSAAGNGRARQLERARAAGR
jgi:excisionase family DNA binding protein